MLLTSMAPPAAQPVRAADAVGLDAERGAFAHLRAFQGIAAANGGNRAAGTPGYDRSAEYVADRLRQAGHEVRFEEFTFPFFEERSPPRLLSGAAQTAAPREALRTLAYSGSGDVTGRLRAVDLGLTEAAPPPPSTSGCEASDFAGFDPGAIALVRRGTCPFQTKVENAVSAGAIGVVIMNEGTSGRSDAFSGRLAKAATVPVVAVGYEFGRSLERMALAEDGGPIRLVVDVQTGSRATRNVIAETRAGDPSRTIVVGAHLDSVSEGPGINDNGSGSAAVLEVALSLAGRPTQPRNRIRFAFWGAEEVGLFGSRHHANGLSEEGRRHTALYVNLDMVGSPNYGRFIHGPGQEPAGGLAAVALGAMLEFFQERRLPVEVRDPGRGRHSDDASFIEKGIPSIGLYTGAGETKPDDKAVLFGGAAGQPYDPCYHKACDTLENIDKGVLDEMTGALERALEAAAAAWG